MNVGDEWIYRLRHYAQSERVRILAVERRKTSIRVDVEFLDGDKRGTRENVPGSRLCGPWSEVEGYDQIMAKWECLEFDDFDIDEVEDYAITMAFGLLIPKDVAEQEGQPVRDVVAVYDQDAFESLIGVPLTEITAVVEWFDLDSTVMLSPAAGPIVTELACRRNPMPVLNRIMEEGAEIRERCKRGREYVSPITKKEQESSPEQEYRFYLNFDRPRHELLRQWCGHRAVTFQQRLEAAEAEVRRLDILVARLIDMLKDSNAFMAEDMEREHERDRIRPENVRPVIDRPLEWWEMPVVHVKAKQRSWW